MGVLYVGRRGWGTTGGCPRLKSQIFKLSEATKNQAVWIIAVWFGGRVRT